MSEDLRARLLAEADECERYADEGERGPWEDVAGLLREAAAALAAPGEPVNWEASYHQACDDADAYKVQAEARIAKAEQNWRSCQHEVDYLRKVRDEYKALNKAALAAPGEPARTFDLAAGRTIQATGRSVEEHPHTVVKERTPEAPLDLEALAQETVDAVFKAIDWRRRDFDDDKATAIILAALQKTRGE